MRTTMNHAKSLVTREINAYNGEIKPFRSELMNSLNLVTGSYFDDKGKVFIDFNDNYKELIKGFIDTNYKAMNEALEFLQAYKELTLYIVAREIDNIIQEEKKVREITEKEQQKIIDDNLSSMYFISAKPLDEETLMAIYNTNKVMIMQNIENVRNHWNDKLVAKDIDFTNKVEVAIDYYIIDYIYQNINEEIRTQRKFFEQSMEELW